MTAGRDELAARFGAALNQPLTSRLDFNRDGVVNAADQLVARYNPGFLLMLDVDGLVETLVAGTAESEDDAQLHAALAFALTLGDDDARGEEPTHDAWRSRKR